MAMTTDRTSVTVDGMKALIVSDIVQDEENAVWVRTLKFYDVDPNVVNAKPILELTIKGDAQAGVQIQTPQLEF